MRVEYRPAFDRYRVSLSLLIFVKQATAYKNEMDAYIYGYGLVGYVMAGACKCSLFTNNNDGSGFVLWSWIGGVVGE